MPILDPSLQFNLLDKCKKGTSSDGMGFFLFYLRIARHNLNRSRKAIEAANRFKKDLKELINLLKFNYVCKIEENELENPSNNNIYEFIYNKIDLASEMKRSINQKGVFYICTDRFQTKLFQLDTFDSKSHTWFILDTPIAVLCLFDTVANSSILLEIDLLAASGYTLVLCVSDAYSDIKYLLKIIKTNQFSEIHVNSSIFFNHFINIHDLNFFDHIDAYFYFYTIFDQTYHNEKLKKVIKTMKKMPKINIISFSSNDYSCLGNDEFRLITTKPFAYCKDGFHYDYLRIRLANVPLYDSDDIISTFIPTQTSDFCTGFISHDDFMNWKTFRVKIFIDDSPNQINHTYKYINFEDIHKIKPELFFKNQLILAKINNKILSKVDTIEKNINKKIHENDECFIKEKIISLIKEKKISQSLEYVAYAYSFSKLKQGDKFFAHKTQIYTAYEACKKFIFRNKDKSQKGIVFQVETGEGKTCIVCLIAAALSLMKKTVHITSSNIKLSIRDFEESFAFFKLLDLQSAVLVHSNELPLSIKRKLKHEIITENATEIQLDENNKKKDDHLNDELQQEEDEDDDDDPFFGYNSQSYFKLHSKATESNLDQCYTSKHYAPELFRNSSRMNYSICGIDDQGQESNNKANIVFSTFVNFECFYLKMVELCPGSIQKYFSQYGLLIDEADSILIDEIANGTIISRSMNSNAVEILKFVYEQYIDNKSYEQTYNMIQNKNEWSLCKSLITKEIVKQMYDEIKLVHEPDYKDGKKYSIEKIEIKKKKKKMNRILKNVLNFTKDVAIDIFKDFMKEFTKDPDSIDDDDQDDDEDEDDDDQDDDDDENDNKSPKVTFKYIVPFGYDRNGILEPNKEFGGFIQQFIAIKESIENKVENMIINDVSMSYLYISHPIFVKLYGNVCGFTGTIGNKYDKKIFQTEYSLTTMKVPRHNPNLQVEFPMILCKDKNERNQKIVLEVLEMHKRGNPVLVIFQDLKEIDDVEYMLGLHNIKYINIFYGKDEIVKPDEIAGLPGAISLGTNVCGRGTNIIAKELPLHVIVSYYSSNIRIMKQAFGRTARQGQKGSYRVICLESQFFQPIDILKDTNLLLDEFSIKNRRQKEFVEYFEKNRKWIFSGFPNRQKIDGKILKELRNTKINVNRIVACNYVFPICMTKEIFLTIQEQRIFSLFNCPDCKYTWRLFQRYLRELILETWSLMINEIDLEYKNKDKGIEYNNEIGARMKNLFKIFDNSYLPNKKENIINTFMFIFNKVRKSYEKEILKDFSEMACPLLEFDSSSFFSCKAGFKPYSLLSESGARINYKNFKKTNFIKDPELIFEKKTVKKKFHLISITEKIDDIFNNICMKVNEILGSKTFLKLFLRRTIAGCEFGFCLILDIENQNNEFIKKNPFCIIDRDPLLVFTIFVKSIAPILAIILISVLIYLTSIAKKIAKWFTFPSNVKESLKKTATIVINAFASNVADRIYEKIINFLDKNLNENIKQLKLYDKKGNAKILQTLKNLFDSSKVETLTNKMSNYLGDVFNIKSKLGNIGETLLKPVPMMRISAYLLLLLASFIMIFRYKRHRIEDYSKESQEYNDNPNEIKINEIINRHQNDVNILDINPVSHEEENEYNSSYKKQSKTYLYKMTSCDIIEKYIQAPSFKLDKKSLIAKGVTCLARGIYQYNQKCTRMTYSGDKKIFLQQVLFYTTNKYPSIIPFIGYNIEKNNQHIFIETKEKGTLKSFLNDGNKINLTQKLIIAYGIACAINHLHNNNIVHRYIKPSNIYLDSNLYPYLANFYHARQIQTPFPYYLKSMSLKYEAPEFLMNYKDNQNSFYLDVYSFGMFLYNLITEKTPFNSYNNNNNREQLIIDIKKGKRPEFPDSFPKELENWKKLIIDCWNQEPYKRPGFKAIIATLESDFIRNKNIDQNTFLNYKKNILKIEDPSITC